MVAAQGIPEFEVSSHLHANYGAIALDSPPGEWVEILRIQAGVTRRVTVGWRRGAGPYVPIPGGTLEMVEVLSKDLAKGGDTDAEAKLDERISDPSKWALEVATTRWKIGTTWAKKNGPVIDVQLACWAVNPKKGCLEMIKGAVSAKRVDLTGASAAGIDGPAPGTPEYMNLALLSALNAKDERINDVLKSVTDNYRGLGTAMDVVMKMATSAIEMKDSASTAGTADRQADRAFFLQLASNQMIAEGVDKGIGELSPILKDLAANWQPGGGGSEPISTLAKKLLDSFTDEQAEKVKAAKLEELFADLKTGLQKIIDCDNNKDVACNVLGAFMPALARNENLIGPILSGSQREAIILIVKGSGFKGV